METTQLASGTLFIHSASTALRSHIEWAADAAFVMPAPLRWTSPVSYTHLTLPTIYSV